MAEIKVTSTQLRSKASELRQLNNRFKSAVSSMTSTESSLMNMWDGEAKTAFHKAYTSDKNQMDTFYQTIEKYCQALENNAKKYDEMESKNVQTATSRTYK